MGGVGDRRPHSRFRLTLIGFAGLMLGAAVAIGLPAAISGSESTFLWLAAGACLVLAAALLLIGLKGCQSRGRSPTVQLRSPSPHRWRDTALVLAALVTILSPAIKLAIDVADARLRPVARQERECRALLPQGWARRS